MAKVKIFEVNGIAKYNHNHDPATGRFTTGSGGSGSSSSGSGGSGSGGSGASSGSGGSSNGGVDYEGLRTEMEEKLEQVKNHPLKDERPEAYKQEVALWERRLQQLDEKYGPKKETRSKTERREGEDPQKRWGAPKREADPFASNKGKSLIERAEHAYSELQRGNGNINDPNDTNVKAFNAATKKLWSDYGHEFDYTLDYLRSKK